jgi:hypothetical protein
MGMSVPRDMTLRYRGTFRIGVIGSVTSAAVARTGAVPPLQDAAATEHPLHGDTRTSGAPLRFPG